MLNNGSSVSSLTTSGSGTPMGNGHAPVMHSTPSHSKISLSSLKKQVYPVIQELEYGKSLRQRTLDLVKHSDIGPVDLVHIATLPHSSRVSESGQYHFINGLDVSSTDAPMAYITSLLLNFESGSKKDTHTVTYCSYNCFTKGDLRIKAEFPGNITTSFVFSDPSKPPLYAENIPEDIWLETSVSLLIRSLLCNQETSRILPGMVKLNPLQTHKICLQAIDQMCQLLPKGASAGCKPSILTPSVHKNYLVDALLQIIKLTKLGDYCMAKLDSLPAQFVLLKAKILLLSNKETEAVRTMYEGIKENPRDAMLLLEQANYLISKQKPKLALISAHRLLNAMPTEFECWEMVVQLYIILGDFKALLMTLNSAPMYSPKNQDHSTFSTKDDLQLDEPFEGCIEKIWDSEIELIYGTITPLNVVSLLELQSCDPVLIKIFNNTRLYGTFARSYKLISNMVRIIGWDAMLELRSKIFVMEDEITSTGNDLAMFRDKVLCERWLDHLFLVLYDDLRVVMIWENERMDSVIRHSALEWLLIGLLLIRCHHYESGIAALKTTINNKFNYFASLALIQIFQECQTDKFKALHNLTIYNGDIITKKLMNDEYVLKLVVKHLSYEKRYYGEFDPDLFLILQDYIDLKYSSIYLKSFIAGEFSQDLRLFAFTDRVIDWISMFIE